MHRYCSKHNRDYNERKSQTVYIDDTPPHPVVEKISTNAQIARANQTPKHTPPLYIDAPT